MQVTDNCRSTRNTKKTISFLRSFYLKDKKCIKSLEKETAHSAKVYKDLENRFISGKETIRKQEESLKSNRDLLNKATSENVQKKQKLDTKESMETADKENVTDEVFVIEQESHDRNMLACEKCQFVTESKQELMGHNKFIYLDCHFC